MAVTRRSSKGRSWALAAKAMPQGPKVFLTANLYRFNNWPGVEQKTRTAELHYLYSLARNKYTAEETIRSFEV